MSSLRNPRVNYPLEELQNTNIQPQNIVPRVESYVERLHTPSIQIPTMELNNATKAIEEQYNSIKRFHEKIGDQTIIYTNKTNTNPMKGIINLIQLDISTLKQTPIILVVKPISHLNWSPREILRGNLLN